MFLRERKFVLKRRIITQIMKDQPPQGHYWKQGDEIENKEEKNAIIPTLDNERKEEKRTINLLV